MAEEQTMAEETQQLLRSAVARAGKVRTALAEMREHAFASAAAAATTGGSPTHAGSPERRQLHAAAPGSSSLQVLPLLLLPQGMGQAGSPELKALASQLPPGLSLGSAASMGPAAQVGPAPGDFQWLPTGERGASPKTSQRKAWGSPGSRRRRQQQDEQQPPAGGGGGGGPSFEDVLAALCAEGFVRQGGPAADPVDREAHAYFSGSPQQHMPERSSFTGGTERRSRDAASPARGPAGSRASGRCARRSLDSGAGSSLRPQSSGTQQSLQGGRHRRQQQEQQQPSDALTTFNLMEAERQLREKMEQVNAAKRYNDARMRSSGSAGMVTTPRGLPAVAVPRLPLASLGRAGSAASSRQNSSRLSGRESDQRHWRPWQLQSSSPPRSPPVAGRRAAAAAPEEQAPLAREERARPAAAGTGTAVPPPSASKESRITLTELLSTTPGPSNRGPPSRSESRAAAGAASAEQGSLQGLRQSAVSLDCAPSPSASTSTAGGWKAAVAAAAEAAALREQQEAARQQAEAEEAVRASCVQLELAASGEPCLEQGLVPAPGADGSVHLAAGPAAAVDVVPGESAAPPIQDTPRDEAAAEEAPVQLPAEGPGVGGSSLAAAGKLQSPPATPLEHVTADARPRPAPSGSGDSSASPSPEQARHSNPSQQHRQAHSSLLPGPPSLGGDEAPPLQPLQQQQQQLEAAADSTPPPRQQRADASISIAPLQLPSIAVGGDKLAQAEPSSSIGRKRANSEAGCIEGPASVKKRSPEVSSSRLVACTPELQAAAPEAAAPLQPATAGTAAVGHAQRPQAGLFGNAASRGSPGGAGQPQRQHGQQELVQSLPALLPAVQLPPAVARPKPELEQLSLTPVADSHRKYSSNLVMPVVLEHTPPHQQQRQRLEQQQRQRNEQQQRQQQQQQCQEQKEQRPHNSQQVQPAQQEPQKQPVTVPTVTASAAAAAVLPAPTASVQSAQAANSSPSAALAADVQSTTEAAKPVQPAHAPAKPVQSAQAAPKPVQPPLAVPKPVQPPLAVPKPVQPAQAAPKPELSAPAAPGPVPPQRAASTSSLIDSLEEELPAHSRWVSSRHGSLYEQQPLQQQQQQQHLAQQQGQQGAAQQGAAGPRPAAAQAPEGELPASSQWVPSRSGSPVQEEPEPQSTPPPSLRTAAAAAMAATAAAAASMAAHAINITPRRRMAALEPPEAELALLDHPKGKQLLAAAPELAHMSGDTLLGMVQQGCIVRKAWVRPNFKQGGSTRRVQLAPGSSGRAELLYPHGLFRKPLRFAVRRAVVNSSAWHPGDYLVLDTARGMLRLEPVTAAEHALWVLALNAAFLASGAPAASGAGGSSLLGGAHGEESSTQRCMQLAVGAMRWSAAILLG